MNLNEPIRPRRFYYFCGVIFFSFVIALQNPFYWPIFFLSIFGAYKSFKNGTVSFRDSELKDWERYHLGKYEKLLSAYDQIATFSEVEKWDEEASQEKKCIEIYNDKLDEFIKSNQAILKVYLDERDTMPFFKRLFRYRGKERLVMYYINHLHSYFIWDPVHDLSEKIDFSPNDKNQQIELLEKLTQLKDTYNHTKKSLALDAKDVRETAKLRNAEINDSYFSTPASRRMDRQENKKWKDKKIANIENQKYDLSQKVHRIEKQILWVKRIKDSKEPKVTKESKKSKDSKYDVKAS